MGRELAAGSGERKHSSFRFPMKRGLGKVLSSRGGRLLTCCCSRAPGKQVTISLKGRSLLQRVCLPSRGVLEDACGLFHIPSTVLCSPFLKLQYVLETLSHSTRLVPHRF